ncbi:MAG: EamA family transporter [Microthrixaceae bacterium]|nr:EamA family transporter [Microthrixaceae bacterium]MCB9376667.1 EamA family transporter [Microthrixaceae bacterium]MCO5307105.1 DMT family transporter [Microthrixaceae bacterium]
MSRIGVARCLAAAVLFGASAPAASVLAGDMPALVLAGLLYLGAAIAVTPAVVRHRPNATALSAGWRPLAIAVVFGGALGPVLLVAGLARTSAATASLLLNFELVATILLAATLFREHLGARLLAAAALVSTAGVILVWQPGVAFDTGGLFVIGACACWGLDNAVTSKIDQLSPEQITLTKGLVAGGANLILGLMLASSLNLRTGEVLAALAIGALGYGASITLWVKGARDLGAARGQVIFAAAPFIGAAVAWVFLGDAVTFAQLVAVPVAIVGVGLSLRSGHEHRHVHEPIVHEHEHRHDDGHHTHTHTPPVTGRHTHRHEHAALVHAHPHVPDLHHRHAHHDE